MPLTRKEHRGETESDFVQSRPVSFDANGIPGFTINAVIKKLTHSDYLPHISTVLAGGWNVKRFISEPKKFNR
jgi:hypothetical protein